MVDAIHITDDRGRLYNFSQDVLDVFDQLLRRTNAGMKIFTIDDVRKLTDDRLGQRKDIYETALKALHEMVC